MVYIGQGGVGVVSALWGCAIEVGNNAWRLVYFSVTCRISNSMDL